MNDIVKPCVREPWAAAAGLVSRWLDRPERIDALMESLPPGLTGAERARCQHLVFGVVRHAGRIEAALGRLVAHPPRFITRAVLHLAGFELIEGGAGDDGRIARIVHHTVERTKSLASPAEARFVNAVVRKLALALAAQAEPGRLAPAAELAEYFSHPDWLVRRWLATFGAEPARALLRWNQSPSPVYARWRDSARPAPDWLPASRWPGFHEVPPGRWSEIAALLASGSLYLQDPGTRASVELLAPRPGETVLDLGAAPGGKSLLIADAMGAGGAATGMGNAAMAAGSGSDDPARGGARRLSRLVAWDLPAARIDRLKENLSRVRGVETLLVQGDLLHDARSLLAEHGLPAAYSAVLLDAPCSNTGVMRHRVDVKWRLAESDLAKHPRQQLSLLTAAGLLVAPGGRLVYSTCSLEPAENEGVVRTFLERNRLFTRVSVRILTPWEAGHDGAAAFLLARAPA